MSVYLHHNATSPMHPEVMAVEDNPALNAVRISFGMNNSLQDVDALFTKLQQLINKLPAVIRQVIRQATV